jgi:hypothetical protein
MTRWRCHCTAASPPACRSRRSGTPPPPSLSVASLVTVSRVQTRTFFGQVLPSYQAWLSGGARPNTYPAFMLFVSSYPCSPTDRMAYAYLYLEVFPP